MRSELLKTWTKNLWPLKLKYFRLKKLRRVTRDRLRRLAEIEDQNILELELDKRVQAQGPATDSVEVSCLIGLS